MKSDLFKKIQKSLDGCHLATGLFRKIEIHLTQLIFYFTFLMEKYDHWFITKTYEDKGKQEKILNGKEFKKYVEDNNLTLYVANLWWGGKSDNKIIIDQYKLGTIFQSDNKTICELTTQIPDDATITCCSLGFVDTPEQLDDIIIPKWYQIDCKYETGEPEKYEDVINKYSDDVLWHCVRDNPEIIRIINNKTPKLKHTALKQTIQSVHYIPEEEFIEDDWIFLINNYDEVDWKSCETEKEPFIAYNIHPNHNVLKIVRRDYIICFETCQQLNNPSQRVIDALSKCDEGGICKYDKDGCYYPDITDDY